MSALGAVGLPRGAWLFDQTYALNHPETKKKIALLLADARIQAMQGQAINYGDKSGGLNPHFLGIWWLYQVNKRGPAVANRLLEAWLSADRHIVRHATFFAGVTVDQAVEIGPNLWLRPLEQMIEWSAAQEALGFAHPDPMSTVNATVALCSDIEFKKVIPSSEMRLPDMKASSEAWGLHDRVIPLIAALPSHWFSGLIQTSQSLDTAPPGPFGSGSQGYEDTPRRSKRSSQVLTGEDAAALKTLVAKAIALSPEEFEPLERSLRRLSIAKFQSDMHDRALDLGIALEGLMQFDVPSEVSFQFRLRGSLLAATEPDDRKSSWNVLKAIYALRSEVAHKGVSATLKKAGRGAGALLLKHEAMAEQVFRAAILKWPVDWETEILGGKP